MKIVVAYDGSIQAGVALDDLQWAGLPRNAQAMVLSVLHKDVSFTDRYHMMDGHNSMDQAFVSQQVAEDAGGRLARYFPLWDIQMETRWGPVTDIILEKARTWGADLIVVGTHGRSPVARALLGTVSLKLINEAPCSIRVGRASKHAGPTRLMIGFDGSPESSAAVDEVCRRTWRPGTLAKVIAVHELLMPAHVDNTGIGKASHSRIDEPQHHFLEQAAEETAKRLQQLGLDVSFLVEEGDPTEVLVEAARTWNADTLFVGGRVVNRLQRLFHRVASTTAANSPCSVEVIRLRAAEHAQGQG